MRPFTYSRPSDIDEAVACLQDEARVLAGGTDLLTLMKADIERPRALVDIKRLTDLGAHIERRGDFLELGALARLTEIERHPEVLEHYPALAQAAAQAATPQLRNAATLGGNLLQQPRCWYFRSPHLECWRRGGEHCPARDGENRLHALFGHGPCVSVHPSDLAPALLALDAVVTVRSSAGEREMTLAELYAEPDADRRSEVMLGRTDLLLALRLPASRGKSVYLKAMDRKTWAFALAGVAASVVLDGDVITDARIVLAGVAPIPWRVPAAERALMEGASPEQAADVALEDATPLGQNGYKVPLARALVRRAIDQCLGSGPPGG